MITPPALIDIDGEYAALSHCAACGQWLTRFCDLCESAHDVARQFPNGFGSVASDRSAHGISNNPEARHDHA